MRLLTLAKTSALLGVTRNRVKKRGLLAESLQKLAAEEVAIGVCNLIGDLPQDRIGVGSALLRKAVITPANDSRLTLQELRV